MITKEVWKEIRQMWSDGYKKGEIAKELHINFKTVEKHLKCDLYPGYRMKEKRGSKLDSFRSYISKRVKNTNIRVVNLYEELQEKGYTGKKGIISEYVRELKAAKNKRHDAKSSKILLKQGMSRHLQSYRKKKISKVGEVEMAGKRAEFALTEYRAMYKKASKLEKGNILGEFCKLTKYHRKYAIELLIKEDSRNKENKSRKKVYSKEALYVIERIWEAADYPWSERLKVLLPIWLPWAKNHMKWINSEMEKEVLAISARQIDRRLKEKKKSLSRKMYGRTKPGSLLKHHIPIKTDNWDVKEPGFTEIDLVSHSGSNASGTFIYSLNMTDIHTGWVETIPIMGKTEIVTANGLREIKKDLPFLLKGIDSDNGSEFINEHLFRYCERNEIQFTRGRPYKKNDNAHIEQKNWTHVRKILGYERYDSDFHLSAMRELYRKKLRLMMNLFQPCVKLKNKERVGSKLKRKYEQPKTPLERLVEYHNKNNIPLTLPILRLIELRNTTDPFRLSKDIEKLVKQIKEYKNIEKTKTTKAV